MGFFFFFNRTEIFPAGSCLVAQECCPARFPERWLLCATYYALVCLVQKAYTYTKHALSFFFFFFNYAVGRARVVEHHVKACGGVLEAGLVTLLL